MTGEIPHPIGLVYCNCDIYMLTSSLIVFSDKFGLVAITILNVRLGRSVHAGVGLNKQDSIFWGRTNDDK